MHITDNNCYSKAGLCTFITDGRWVQNKFAIFFIFSNLSASATWFYDKTGLVFFSQITFTTFGYMKYSERTYYLLYAIVLETHLKRKQICCMLIE